MKGTKHEGLASFTPTNCDTIEQYEAMPYSCWALRCQMHCERAIRLSKRSVRRTLWLCTFYIFFTGEFVVTTEVVVRRSCARTQGSLIRLRIP